MRTGTCSPFFLLLLCCALWAWPATVTGGELSLQSGTLLRVFERDTGSNDDLALPAYEYLQLDLGHLDTRGLSFHLYGWGRYDLADSDIYPEQSDEELLYGYVQYRYPDSSFQVRLGRQYVFGGVANESLDGLWLSTNLGRYLTASVYTGLPVGLSSTDGDSGDSIHGGRFAYRSGGGHEFGLSYKLSENDKSTAEEQAGLDVAFYLPYGTSLFGNSVRNLESEGWAEHAYELRCNFDNLILRPHFEMFQYDDYFAAGANAANPFRFLGLTDEELTLYGLDVTWQFSEAWELGARTKGYQYDQRDSARYASLLANWRNEETASAGIELGYMDGDDASDEYLLARVFYYQAELPDQLMPGFLSGDIVYVDYGEAIYGEGSSLFLSLGGGQRFLDEALAVELSGDYSRDPYFDSDLRLMLKLTYQVKRDL